MKDILKTLEQLEEHIDRLAEQGIYEIERDLLLERLRGLYATVTSLEVAPTSDIDEPVMYGCPVAPFSPLEEVEEEPEVAEEEPEVVAEEPELPQIAEEPVTEEEPEPIEEPVTEEEPTEVSEELDHEVVMSLYDDDEDEEEPTEPTVEHNEPEEEEEDDIVIIGPEEEPTEEPEPEVVAEEPAAEEEPEVVVEEPAEEPQSAPQSVVLGDILATEQPTLADNLAEQLGADVASAASANLSLRQTIAINDKYILMRDLFAGSNDYYETAIDRLDSFDNLDEAMLYIYDHFHWNPNSEGARLLMELLARKLF